MMSIILRNSLRCAQKCYMPNIKIVSTKRFLTTKKLTPQFAIEITPLRNSDEWRSKSNNNNQIACSLALMSFFGIFKSKEEKQEPEVITTIKRSVLLIQKAEYKKAEKMLHIALKQAQDIQNSDAVTYIYDLMANLAFVEEDYKKAEKLFTTVMQRLMADGVPQNDLRIIHMSLKMAKMYEYQEDFEKATSGYQYCLDHLQKLVTEGSEDVDVLTFYGMTMDWYARMLVTLNKFEEAYNYFLKAYDVSVKVHGEIHPETVVLLNDLGTISCHLGHHDKAIEYIKKALDIGKRIEGMEDISVIYVNLGNVFIKKEMFEEAKKWCKEGWRLAKVKNDDESLKEAKLCLDEVNKVLP